MSEVEVVEGQGDTDLTVEEDGRVVVVGVDPGVSTGLASFAVDRVVLLREGVSVGRMLRSGGMGTALIARSGSGLYGGEVPLGVLSGGVEVWDNYTVDRIVEYVREVWVTEGVDPALDVFAVACEDFILRTSDSARHTLAPVRVNAALAYALKGSGVRLWQRQSASDAKRAITDDRLRRWDLYEAGPEHRRDARRHAILWMRKWRDDPRFRAMFPVGMKSSN